MVIEIELFYVSMTQILRICVTVPGKLETLRREIFLCSGLHV